MSDFYKLSLASVDPLTPNAVALTFAIPDSLKTIFSFEAGQYITLKHEVNGQEVRRAYSISSAPSSGILTVGIKKVEGGIFSCLLYTSPSPRDLSTSRMPSSA